VIACSTTRDRLPMQRAAHGPMRELTRLKKDADLLRVLMCDGLSHRSRPWIDHQCPATQLKKNQSA
jgi:hypothetical protein